MRCGALFGGLRNDGMQSRALGRLREKTARGFLSQTLFFPCMERTWFREFPFKLQRLRLTAVGRLRSRLTARPPVTAPDFSGALRDAAAFAQCVPMRAARSAATASHPHANGCRRTAPSIKPRQRSGAITQAGRRPAVRGSGGVFPRCGKCDQSVKTLFRRKAGKVFADLIAFFRSRRRERPPKASAESSRGCRALSPAEGGCREGASSPSRQTTPRITSRRPQSAVPRAA